MRLGEFVLSCHALAPKFSMIVTFGTGNRSSASLTVGLFFGVPE
jgi:hypothetical protein